MPEKAFGLIGVATGEPFRWGAAGGSCDNPGSPPGTVTHGAGTLPGTTKAMQTSTFRLPISKTHQPQTGPLLIPASWQADVPVPWLGTTP